MDDDVPIVTSPLVAPRVHGRRTFLAGVAASAALAALPAGRAAAASATKPLIGTRRPGDGPAVAVDWVETLYAVVFAEGLTPPAAARFYYGTAVAMYESTLTPSGRRRSLGGQLIGLDRAPMPRGSVDAAVALSTTVAIVAAGLVPNASPSSLSLIERHRSAVVSDRRRAVVAPIVARSQRHGAAVARRLLEWLSQDGYASAVSLPYDPPVGEGLWRSTPPNYGTAIEPHWHLVRPAVLSSPDEIAPTPPVPFSSVQGSAFHEQAMTTYRQSFANSDEEIAIARFWTDNPRLSGLPSGHWFLVVARLAAGPLQLDLDETLESLALLGVALHDAFTNCWTWKYRYQLIRPVSYIRDHVDPNWSTVVNTPQFPEYTSGHSVGSGAAEVVLTALHGDVAFTDRTGEDRGLAPRSFTSFAHAAQEAAMSRLYGGIHYPMAIEHGLTQGREVGGLVLERVRTRG